MTAKKCTCGAERKCPKAYEKRGVYLLFSGLRVRVRCSWGLAQAVSARSAANTPAEWKTATSSTPFSSALQTPARLCEGSCPRRDTPVKVFIQLHRIHPPLAPPGLKFVTLSDRQEDFKVVPFRTATTEPSNRLSGTFLLRRLHLEKKPYLKNRIFSPNSPPCPPSEKPRAVQSSTRLCECRLSTCPGGSGRVEP
jgi:hypothetical protein